jgi:hypothetical protein
MKKLLLFEMIFFSIGETCNSSSNKKGCNCYQLAPFLDNILHHFIANNLAFVEVKKK